MSSSRRALAVLLLPLLAACGAGEEASDSRPQVVTGFYALEYITERVAGDRAQVSNLTSPGQEPHDAELTVAQTAEVVEAELVVRLAGFQPVVDEVVDQSTSAVVVDAADAADLISSEGSDTPPRGDGVEPETAAAEDADQSGGPPDPHFWLDPIRLAAVAEDVAAALVEIDPEGRASYETNLVRLQRDLATLDEDYRAGLATCERDTVVTSHDAFQYLADRYGVAMYSIAGISPDAEPSPARLRELQDLIEAEGLTTVFHETLTTNQLSEALSQDLGLRSDVLDPVEGLSDETAGEDYLSLMRRNLDALQEANECR